MKFGRVICISIENIMCHTSRFFLSVLLIALSMLGIGYFILFSSESKYVKDECNRVLARGVEKTGVIKLSESGTYESKKLKEKAMASGKIECIGTWLSGDLYWTFSEELVLEKNKKRRDGPKMGWVNIDRTMLGICNLKFAQKKEIPEEKWLDPDWCGIYLGWEYRNIPLGTVYPSGKSIPGYPKEFEVIGILEKGQEFITWSVLHNGQGGGVYSVESWDEVIVSPMQLYVSDGVSTNNILYTPAEGITLKEAESYLVEEAEKLGLKVYPMNLSEGFYLGEINQQDRRRIEGDLCRMLCTVCFLVNVCLLITQMISVRKEMGIYFACGFSDRDVFGISIWQSILATVIAWTAAAAGLRGISHLIYTNHTRSARTWQPLFNRWFYWKALPQMAVFGIVLLAVLAVIQMIAVKKAVPAEWLRDPRGVVI